jgi:hypothetical protein
MALSKNMDLLVITPTRGAKVVLEDSNNGRKGLLQPLPYQYDASEEYDLDFAKSSSEQESILSKIELYPNPSNGMVYLSVENNNSIKNMEVFNAQGELILIQSSKNNHSSQLDLRSQSNGLYLLKIYTINGIVIKRFSIAK